MKNNAQVLPFPTWLEAEEASAKMSESAWELISNTGSLTERLRELTDFKIQHRLLSANWDEALSAERHALHLDDSERTWVRKIEWRYNSDLWVYARAIFPESTLKATGTMFPGLGVQSLGEIIFKDPNLKRSPFHFTLLNDKHPLHSLLPADISSDDAVWARQSTITYQEHPILITEIFFLDRDAQRIA